MTRLTKVEIEQSLKLGKPISWKDGNNKSSLIILDTAKQRRLFAYLLESKIRDVKKLTTDFVDGLAASLVAPSDPASDVSLSATMTTGTGPWKIQSVRIEGFGGVNVWNGKPFEWNFDQQSLLIEGPNGSGKSSLAAAIIWALTGMRPRDYDETTGDEKHPVFGEDDKSAGEWCPVAAYPESIADLKATLSVNVVVTFSDPHGALAAVSRSFDDKGMTFRVDPGLELPDVLLEAGLAMPARLPQLRLDEGKGRLTDAVQKLTGLDDLIELGIFVQGLCHKGRDYLSYKSSELAAANLEFQRQIEIARTALAPAAVSVSNFRTSDTDYSDGDLAAFGKMLQERASELTKVISEDLGEGLNLTDPTVQKQVVAALVSAQEDISGGVEFLPAWKTFEAIRTSLTSPVRDRLREALITADADLAAAQDYYQKQQADTRYRLKAAGAHWHNEQAAGPIESCPLCEQSIKQNPQLVEELEVMRSAGEAATRKFEDNVNAILAALERDVPQPLKRYLADGLPTAPREVLLAEVRAKFVSPERYTKYLSKCGKLIDQACDAAPIGDFKEATTKGNSTSASASVIQRIFQIETMCALAAWFEIEREHWQKWWSTLSKVQELGADGFPADGIQESVSSHLVRLGRSLGEAEPFRIAADAMRVAWKQGKIASDIDKELALRTEITDALAPLKSLGNLAEAQARTAINELSDRIGKIHSAIYLSERLQFKSAALEKKTGLIVRGRLSSEIHIDATLVANTSWLRGILWAFIFALREEAVEQLGRDPFPILVLDDPQQTFDSEHRHRWAEYIAALQKGGSKIQLVLTTHEETFLTTLKIDGIDGRHTLICSADNELGHIALIEGDSLDRRWKSVQESRTPAAALSYMADVRVFAEGVLRLMLRGEDIDFALFSIGSARKKISDLNKAGIEPWNRSVFSKLAGILSNGIKEIKFIETAHHSAGKDMGMGEATDVEKYWQQKLRPILERAFRLVREHRALHGGLTALHAMPPTISLPEGYKAKLRELTFPVVGSAAALSDGRAADGCVDMNLNGSIEKIQLKDHFVFRLISQTLEPVARSGDLLVVSEHAAPTAKSLVVALSDERLLARRLQVADNHSDVAVLTANAVNPRMIAQPLVAKFSTLTLNKIVGVIFDSGKTLPATLGEMEICDCGSEANLTSALRDILGLVEVVGHSAEPYVLDKQFLIIGNSVSFQSGLHSFEGSLVIAEDSNDSRYFKRLRLGDNGLIILESLESSGDFPPVVLGTDADAANRLKGLWPVLGVLFERP